MYTVNNLPKDVKAYVVAREVEGDLWFWGTWDNWGDAMSASATIGGEVFPREVIANI